VFAPVTDAEVVENRVHPDVAPEPGESQQDAVDALVARGARPADMGQRDVPWVVLQDPEGAGFCVLTPRRGARAQRPARSISPSCSALATRAAFVVAGRPTSAYLIRTRLM
jgi:hypothetical protein